MGRIHEDSLVVAGDAVVDAAPRVLVEPSPIPRVLVEPIPIPRVLVEPSPIPRVLVEPIPIPRVLVEPSPIRRVVVELMINVDVDPLFDGIVVAVGAVVGEPVLTIVVAFDGV
jgi:hypothetical protein